MIVNTKWKVSEHDWASPHVIIFSNESPEQYVGSKMSTDKIVDVELRKFTARLDSGAEDPPTTIAELRDFSTVIAYEWRLQPSLYIVFLRYIIPPFTFSAPFQPPFRRIHSGPP